jgi:peptide/nickel transport system permease protein
VKRAGRLLLGLVALLAAAAPWLAPNPPERVFDDLLYAPPTRLRLLAPEGVGTAGVYIHPLRLVSRLERRFEPDRGQPARLQWFTEGRLATVPGAQGGPLLLLGADPFGRDIFSRLLYGARASLALAVVSTALALAIGALVGGVAGYAGGAMDDLLSRFTDFVLVLPAIYVALALRAVMPLVLPATTVFVMLAVIFTLLGWPVVARGVRAIVLAEREREYAIAARAAGAGPVRLLTRHLLPAAAGHVATQATLLLPAFILAEATLSFVGLGFPDTVATWGTMLQDASNVALLGDAPWSLAPAAGIFLVVLGVNLLVQGRRPI